DGDDPARVHDDDLVRALQGGATVGDHQRRDALAFEEAVPELPFGVDIEGAGDIVDHVELGGADEHAGGGAALDLAAGELDPPGADGGFEPVVEAGDVRLHDGGVEGGVDVHGVFGEAEQDVVSQGFAKQARVLRRV